MGRRITNIRQHGFDRIIEIHTAEHILIFELFSKGNLIICDSPYNIIMPMEMQKWKGREIKPKVKYLYPPTAIDPTMISASQLHSALEKSETNLIATLARAFSLGPEYAAEFCHRAHIDGKIMAKDTTPQQAANLLDAIISIERIAPEPCKYQGMVSPFPMETIKDIPERPETFSQALDDFFSYQMLEQKKEDERGKLDDLVEKTELISKKQAQASEKWKSVSTDSKEIADLIYRNYPQIEEIINGMKRARDSGISWDKIKQKISEAKTPQTESIKEIKENSGKVIVIIEDKEIELDFRKTPEENAAKYYEGSKFAKRKIEGADSAFERTEEKLASLREPVVHSEQVVISEGNRYPKEIPSAYILPVESEEPEIEKPKKIKKRWYESYRWFVSSDGFVVIAGKNAASNENIIKKRLEPGDLIFHSDIRGAAFVVIKSKGETIPQQTIREASEFSAAHSKAWAKGLGKVDVFAARPEQIKKTTPEGINLPKGSFVIDGEKSFFRDVPIKLSVGVWINREEGWAKVIAGPLMPVRKLAKYFVTLRPGFSRPAELSSRIKRSLLMKSTPDDKFFIEMISIDDFQGQIPSGMSDMIEGAGDF